MIFTESDFYVKSAKMKPRFSVVIPLFNKEQYVANTIQSVLAQTFGDFELLIINDGSTDNSLEIVKQISDPRISIITQENKGVSATRNHGISVSNTDYITFLDADDYWYPDFLSTLTSLIDSYPSEKVFSAAIEREFRHSVVAAKYSVNLENEIVVTDYFSASLKETVICTSAAVFEKSVFSEAGTFDENLKSGEDTDLWIRIGLKYKVVFIQKILARYILTAKSLSGTTISNIDLDKYRDREKNNPNLSKFLDLNRYSLAIQSKVNGESERYRQFSKNISSLPIKKKIVLKLPAFILKLLINLQKNRL